MCTGGYTLKDDAPKLTLNQVANTNNCCDKTGFCNGNEGGKNDIPCIWPFYTNIVDSDDKPIPNQQGQDFSSCCKYSKVKWRLLVFLILVVVLGRLLLKRYDINNGAKKNYAVLFFVPLSVIAGALIIFSDTIPRWIIHRNEDKWIVAHRGDWFWPWITDFATAAFSISSLTLLVGMYYQDKSWLFIGTILIVLFISIVVFLNLTGK